MNMSFQDDVHQIILRVLDDCGGNKAEAARRLATNPVTFWLWVKKERQPIKDAISRAIDSSGARLVFPLGATPESPSVNDLPSDTETLESQKVIIAELKRKLEKSEDARKSLSGEVNALERQLSRLMPANATPPQTTETVEVVSHKAIGEKVA